MSMPVVDHINVKGNDQTVPYELDTEITENSELLIADSKVYEGVLNAVADDADSLQPVELSNPVSIAGVTAETVVAAIKLIIAAIVNYPTQGSNKFLTTGGAYSDKTTTPASGSTKNLTAGGAYADKATEPEQDSSKNLTAGGAHADKTGTVTEGSTKNLTAAGLLNDSTVFVREGRTSVARASLAYTWFGNITSAGQWLCRALRQNSYNNSIFKYTTVGFYSGSGYTIPRIVRGIAVGDDFDGELFLTNKGLLYKSFSGAPTVEVTGLEGAVFNETGSWVKKVNGRYFVGDGSSNAAVAAETDIESWIRLSAVASAQDIAYFNGVWVVACPFKIYWSNDLQTWHEAVIGGGTQSYSYNCLAYNSNIIVVSTLTGGILWSEDGKNWTQATIPLDGEYGCYMVRYVNNLFIASDSLGGSQTYYSSNGKTWSVCTGLPYPIYEVQYANGIYLAAPRAYSTNAFFYSNNGRNWASCSLGSNAGGPYKCTSYLFVRGKWFAFLHSASSSGKNGIWTSTDGIGGWEWVTPHNVRPPAQEVTTEYWPGRMWQSRNYIHTAGYEYIDDRYSNQGYKSLMEHMYL